MKALVRDINVLLMLRIHTNYYIVCRVISPHPESQKWLTLTNYTVIVSPCVLGPV